MKFIEIILITLAIVAVRAQDKNAGKTVPGSYTYSVEYSNNNNNYGHKIEVKDANSKFNIDLLKVKNSLKPTEKHQRSNAVSTNAVPSLKPADTPLMHYQKLITAPITTPSFAPPQPAPAFHSQPTPNPGTNAKFSSQQLALLLSQNKNPYLPLDKETEKQISFSHSPAWANLLATVPQQQNPPQYASPVQNVGGYSHQVPTSNFVQSPQPAHSASFSDQIIQQFKANQQHIPSSVAQAGAAEQLGGISGFQSHYNQPQHTLPQSFPVAHSPAVPQTPPVPSSHPGGSNYFAAQPVTSTPPIQHSFPGSYGSPAPQISYQPQHLAGLPSSLTHATTSFPSAPVQYTAPQYQTSGQQFAPVHFPSQTSPSAPTVKYEPSNLSQNLVYGQTQGVPNLPNDFSFMSSQASPQPLSNHYGYQPSTSSQYTPQFSNGISSYGQPGASSGLPSASPYSAVQGIAYKPELPTAPVTQFPGQTNPYGSGLGSYTANAAAAAGYASIPSQGSVYGSNSVQGYTSGASSNQVYQAAAPTPYNDVSRSFGTGILPAPAPAHYTVPNALAAGAPSGYSPAVADNTVQNSYRTTEYSPAPVKENANIRYVYVMSHGSAPGTPSNIK